MDYEERREKGGRRLINIIAAGWGNIHFMQCRHKQAGLWGGAEEKNRNVREEEREGQR